MSENLNDNQQIILETVITLVHRSEHSLMYIDGPGGCGKTYLTNTIIHYLATYDIPVITVASSGVAALMLVNGMTAHSRFKIPLNVGPSTSCSWKHRSPIVQTLRNAKLISWDVISMQSC